MRASTAVVLGVPRKRVVELSSSQLLKSPELFNTDALGSGGFSIGDAFVHVGLITSTSRPWALIRLHYVKALLRPKKIKDCPIMVCAWAVTCCRSNRSKAAA